MKKILLNKSWTMQKENTDKLYNVEVPGSVYSHLIDIGEMKNPDIGFNDTEIIRDFDGNYIFKCTVGLDSEFIDNEQVDLVCEGLDTVCDVFVNGIKTGSFANMHRKYRMPVKELLNAGENEIKVHFYSPVEYITNKDKEHPLLENMFCMPGFSQLRKANFMFGWDWGPELPDIGIWKDIYFEGYEKARLESAYITQEHKDGKVYVDIKPETVKYSKSQIGYEIKITSPDGEAVTYTEEEKDIFTYEITEPKLWYPNGYGEQNLYTVTVKLLTDGSAANEKEYTIGLRTIELVENEDEYGRSFFFRVNGLDVFAKGANYIPESNLLSKRRERMEYNLKCAKESHFNMMRIWGGGIYMDDEFYKRCSEYGILIWQDFMYANATCVYNEELEEDITAEITDQVERLRNYPCIAIWVGNNEVEHMIGCGSNFNLSVHEKVDYVKLFCYLIPKVLKKYHPEAIYKHSSPTSDTCFHDSNDFTKGDTHFWRVWFNSEPFTAYRKPFRFCSEFGVQSIHDIKTVKFYAKDDELNFFSPVMENHQKNGNGNKRIMQYIVDEFRYPKDFESLAYVSQLMQAEGVKTGVEYWRSNRGITMGSMYWQLNDCWPGITWSSIDCFGRWKALQYFAKRFYAPVIVSAYEENNEINFAVSNDTRKTVDATVRWQIVNMDNEVKFSGSLSGKVAALSAEKFEKICLPQNIERRKHYVIYKFYLGNKLVSEQILLLASNKQYDFKRPEITFDVREEKDDTVILLKTDCLARYVRLSIKDLDVIFSDNYFDLIKTKEIRINEKMTVDEVRNRLEIVSLTDTY